MSGLSFCLLLIFVYPAFATDQANTLAALTRIRSLVADAEYSKAQNAIQNTLAKVEVSNEQQGELYWHLAICQISMEKQAAANATFAKLLEISPAFEPGPNTSPKILKPFEVVRLRLVSSGAFESLLKPKVRKIEDQMGGGAIKIELRYEGITFGKDAPNAVLQIRRAGSSDFTRIPFTKEQDDLWRASVPSEFLPLPSESYVVDYFVDISTASGVKMTGIGEKKLPLHFNVRPNLSRQVMLSTNAPPKIKTPSWPLWLGLGVAVAGGIILGTLVATSRGEGSLRVSFIP